MDCGAKHCIFFVAYVGIGSEDDREADRREF